MSKLLTTTNKSKISSFKKFLEKNADVIFTEGIPSEDTYISTRELGEWSWDWIADRPSLLKYWRLKLYQHEDITLEKLIEEANYPWCGARAYNLFLAIAVACLGKRKIEKRLKEAGK